MYPSRLGIRKGLCYHYTCPTTTQKFGDEPQMNSFLSGLCTSANIKGGLRFLAVTAQF